MPEFKKTLDISTLESWLWDAACVIRGPIDAPKFKDYILPLVFIKRLSDVFDDECKRIADELGDAKLVEDDHKLVRFYIPKKARWSKVVLQTTGVGQYLTDAVRAVAQENPRLSGVIDVVDFNATTAGQRIVDEVRLASLIQVLSKYRLGLDDVEPDILGRAYEYLLRKFAEGSGQSAGEFYTPREVAVLMARMLDPQPGTEIYDPCCGSGGLLIKCHLQLLETHGIRKNGHLELPRKLKPLHFYGQDYNASAFAVANMNVVIHEMTDSVIKLSDTMNRPAFTNPDGSLRRFDMVTANPMWNQDFPAKTYEHDRYERFRYGIPPSSSADWGWLQHMLASLSDTGRMAVVLDTGAVARGSGTQGANRERDIRKAFVEADLIEAVLLLPENLFYNTTAPGIVIIINRRKKHKGEILLINASKMFTKGRPKNYLDTEHVAQIADIYHKWEEREAVSAIVTIQQAAANDYNLSPSRYVASNDVEPVLPPEEAMVELREAEEERAEADKKLRKVLKGLGLGGL